MNDHGWRENLSGFSYRGIEGGYRKGLCWVCDNYYSQFIYSYVGYDGLRRSLANILFYSLFIMFHIEIYNGYDVPKSKLVGVLIEIRSLMDVRFPTRPVHLCVASMRRPAVDDQQD